MVASDGSVARSDRDEEDAEDAWELGGRGEEAEVFESSADVASFAESGTSSASPSTARRELVAPDDRPSNGSEVRSLTLAVEFASDVRSDARGRSSRETAAPPQ